MIREPRTRRPSSGSAPVTAGVGTAGIRPCCFSLCWNISISVFRLAMQSLLLYTVSLSQNRELCVVEVMLCKVTKWLTWYFFPQRGWSYFTQICSSQELKVFTKPSVFILRHKVITFISAQHLQYRPIVRLTMSLLNVRALDGIQGTRNKGPLEYW